MSDQSGCNVNIVGIQIHYCVGGHKQPPIWIDLDQVKALSWCDAKVNEKPKDKPSTQTPVPKSTGSKNCPKDAVGNGGGPLCWWDGANWQCGEI